VAETRPEVKRSRRHETVLVRPKPERTTRASGSPVAPRSRDKCVPTPQFRPEDPSEVGDHPDQLRVAERVDHVRPVPFRIDQAALPKHCEMLGDVRDRRIDGPSEHTDRGRASRQRVEEKQPLRIVQGPTQRRAELGELSSQRIVEQLLGWSEVHRTALGLRSVMSQNLTPPAVRGKDLLEAEEQTLDTRADTDKDGDTCALARGVHQVVPVGSPGREGERELWISARATA